MKNTNTIAPVAQASVISQQDALALTNNLIANPNVQPSEIPNILNGIFGQFNQAFAPVVEAIVPKKRRRKASTSALIGWPKGVGRDEFKTWKEAQAAKGRTEGLNPHIYKAERDGTQVPGSVQAPAAPAPTPEPTAKKDTKKAATTPAASQAPATAGRSRGGVGRGTSRAGK